MKRRPFEYICTLSQAKLKKHIHKYLKRYYKQIYNETGYLYAKGTLPILLVAHMDTVHKDMHKKFVYEGNKISSPQGIGGDDRCGVYMILELVRKYKCSVLFTEDEECGGIGAELFAVSKHTDDKYNYIIQLDRRGKNDAVFYDCDNYEFEDFITEDSFWKTAVGSFSDICVIAPVMGCAAVNLSSGYYHEHTTKEYVCFDEMDTILEHVGKLIERTKETDKFEYIEAKYASGSWGYYHKSWGNTASSSKDEAEDFGICEGLYGITYYGNCFTEDYDEICAVSEYEAIGKFLSQHRNLRYNDILDIICYGEDYYVM